MFSLHARDLLAPDGFASGAIFNALLVGRGYRLNAETYIGEDSVTFGHAVLIETVRRYLVNRLDPRIEVLALASSGENPIRVDPQRFSRREVEGVHVLVTEGDVLAVARDLEPEFVFLRMTEGSMEPDIMGI